MSTVTMNITKRAISTLNRVLNGRIGRQFRSSTRTREKSRQPGSSSPNHRDPRHTSDNNEVHIKQEDHNENPFPGSCFNNGNSTAAGDNLDETKEKDISQGELEEVEEDLLDWDGMQNPTEDPEALIPRNSSQEPIPSIESDSEYTPIKEQALPYIQRKARSATSVRFVRINHIDPEYGVEEDENGMRLKIRGDELKEDLIAEWEDNLLIAEGDLREYIEHKRTVNRIGTWPKEAARLYKLLYLRGLYPLMGSGWAWDFLDHPMPDNLFAPNGSDDMVLIKAQTNQFQATKALRALFSLYTRVRANRQAGEYNKIGPLIKREIKGYIRWAERDVKLRQIEYKVDYVSPIFVIDFSNIQPNTILDACQKLVENYQAKWAKLGISAYPGLITIFVIVQHMVVVMVVDTRDGGDQEPIPMTELDLSKLNHWLDSAMGIAIPVMLARESLLAYRESFTKTQKEQSDPDI